MLEAIVAVITKGNEILLIQRAPVGGEVEPGESQEAAVVLEAKEEIA